MRPAPEEHPPPRSDPLDEVTGRGRAQRASQIEDRHREPEDRVPEGEVVADARGEARCQKARQHAGDDQRRPGTPVGRIAGGAAATSARRSRPRGGAAARPLPTYASPRATPASVSACQSAPASDAGGHQQPLLLVLVDHQRRHAADRLDAQRCRARTGAAPGARQHLARERPVRQTATRSEVTSAIRVSAMRPSPRDRRAPGRLARGGRGRAASSGETTHHQASAASMARPGRSSRPDGYMSAIAVAAPRTSNLLMLETSASPAVARLTAISAASEPKSRRHQPALALGHVSTGALQHRHLVDSAASPSAPDLVRDLAEQLELRSLVVEGDEVARQRRGEAALGAQRQPLERDVLRGLLDPGLELIGVLELRLLGRDQTRAPRSCPPGRSGAARRSPPAASRTRRRSGRTPGR